MCKRRLHMCLQACSAGLASCQYDCVLLCRDITVWVLVGKRLGADHQTGAQAELEPVQALHLHLNTRIRDKLCSLTRIANLSSCTSSFLALWIRCTACNSAVRHLHNRTAAATGPALILTCRQCSCLCPSRPACRCQPLPAHSHAAHLHDLACFQRVRARSACMLPTHSSTCWRLASVSPYPQASQW